MSYIAHIAVKLQPSFSRYVGQEWKSKRLDDGRNIKWRFKQDRTLELLSELFSEPQDALVCGKDLYVTLLVELLKNGIQIQDAGCEFYEKQLIPAPINGVENEHDYSFFWPQKHYGGGIGLDVYEVNSFEEIEDRAHSFSLSLQVCTDSNAPASINLNHNYFDYSPEAQEYLAIIATAETVFDIGYKMTLYCSMLERLAGQKELKSENTIALIDKVIEFVNKSDIPDNEKNSLVSNLGNGKMKSAQQKLRDLCGEYAKRSYNDIETTDIIRDAYKARSNYSHKNENCTVGNAYLMKPVVLDVICGFFARQQAGDPQ